MFNAEPNLIYVSSQANQIKKNQRYSLSDLKANYLNKVFKTCNIAAITAEIEDVVTKLQQTHRLKFFDLLNEHEQDCVRHALFLDDGSEARNAVLELLATQRRTRVNGTQIWMIKSLANKIREELQAWCRTTNNRLHFQAAATDVSTAKNLRLKLAQNQPDLKSQTFSLSLLIPLMHYVRLPSVLQMPSEIKMALTILMAKLYWDSIRSPAK